MTSCDPQAQTTYQAIECTGTANTNSVWYSWTATSDSTSGSTWYVWNVESPLFEVNGQDYGNAPPQGLAREEIQSIQALHDKANKAREEREAADRRAEELLQEFLDEQQKKDYEEKKYFDIVGQSSKHYRIHKGRSMNIDEFDDEGKPRFQLCGHLDTTYPEGDSILAQMLFLQSHEREFLRIANRRQISQVT